MKKLIITFTIVLIATWSYAAEFSPTVMILKGEDTLQYDFDGDPLTIPIELSGTPGAVWLIINTKGQAENINAIRNGHIGWHYVNNIDTTVYVSTRYTEAVGTSTILWDGTDDDGNIVAAGTYDYYLWGYDDVSPRILASQYVQVGRQWDAESTFIIQKGEDGLNLPEPFFFANRFNYDGRYYNYLGFDNPVWSKSGIHYKWILGGDPLDTANIQTTYVNIYESGGEIVLETGGPALNPTDYNIFYNCSRNAADRISTMTKWEWVTEGDAILDEDWLGWDELTWQEGGAAGGKYSVKAACWSDRNYIYVNSPGTNQSEYEWNKLRCVSFDGEVIFDKMMHEQFMPDDNGPLGLNNTAFEHFAFGLDPNTILIASCNACFIEMINTTSILDDPDVDFEDYGVWYNHNGDYFFDMNYEEDSNFPWACLADEQSCNRSRDCAAVDANGFNIIGLSYVGLNSIGVMTQDGSAIDYMAFADDFIADDVNTKLGGRVCDNGSNFDGLYWSSLITEETIPRGGTGGYGQHTATYIAFDSFHGIITNMPVIEPGVEDAQAAFAVDQNSPNPFNPTTSISFTIPAADHATVEIYNVAGQKVDTLVNGFIDSGKHSVVWDASGFSNGVYFYTVKSGDFSRTMKMTLLK